MATDSMGLMGLGDQSDIEMVEDGSDIEDVPWDEWTNANEEKDGLDTHRLANDVITSIPATNDHTIEADLTGINLGQSQHPQTLYVPPMQPSETPGYSSRAQPYSGERYRLSGYSLTCNVVDVNNSQGNAQGFSPHADMHTVSQQGPTVGQSVEEPYVFPDPGVQWSHDDQMWLPTTQHAGSGPYPPTLEGFEDVQPVRTSTFVPMWTSSDLDDRHHLAPPNNNNNMFCQAPGPPRRPNYSSTSYYGQGTSSTRSNHQPSYGPGDGSAYSHHDKLSSWQVPGASPFCSNVRPPIGSDQHYRPESNTTDTRGLGRSLSVGSAPPILGQGFLSPRQAHAPSPSPSVLSTTSDFPDPLRCSVSGCMVNFIGKFRRGNLGRHTRTVHGSGGNMLICGTDGCTRHYKRSDALKKHRKQQHN